VASTKNAAVLRHSEAALAEVHNDRSITRTRLTSVSNIAEHFEECRCVDRVNNKLIRTKPESAVDADWVDATPDYCSRRRFRFSTKRAFRFSTDFLMRGFMARRTP